MKKQIIARKTVHPLFDELLPHSAGTRWEEFFQSCAKGNLPKNVNLNGRVITYTRSNNTEHYELSQDPKQAFEELKQFFITHSSFGQHLNNENKVCNKQKVEQTKHTSWKNIKGKHIRAALLSHFVDAVEKHYMLDVFQRNQFLYIIHLADIYEILDSSIVMDRGFIIEIACIEYDGTTFYIKESAKPKTRTILYIPGPGNPIYNKYTEKQIDPDELYAKHSILLRKKNKGSMVTKASLFVKSDITTKSETGQDILS
jgi:hypothetical protein